jgi:hypothetical protein
MMAAAAKTATALQEGMMFEHSDIQFTEGEMRGARVREQW